MIFIFFILKPPEHEISIRLCVKLNQWIWLFSTKDNKYKDVRVSFKKAIWADTRDGGKVVVI